MSMKRVAVASEGDGGLQAPVSGHFGRAPSFTVVSVEGERIVAAEVIANPHAVDHKPGVVPKLVKDTGAEAILAGGMGARAAQVFQHLGIEAVTGATGRVEEAVSAWLAGTLRGATPHPGHGHHGEGHHHHGEGHHHHGEGHHHHGEGHHCGGCGGHHH